ncbi:MAG: hypothetical protein OXC54_00220, partial [Rhodospirillaceae bacterium]|nr:hypothetical protein [Rhodospirillaceae bacterium]
MTRSIGLADLSSGRVLAMATGLWLGAMARLGYHETMDNRGAGWRPVVASSAHRSLDKRFNDT